METNLNRRTFLTSTAMFAIGATRLKPVVASTSTTVKIRAVQSPNVRPYVLPKGIREDFARWYWDIEHIEWPKDLGNHTPQWFTGFSQWPKPILSPTIDDYRNSFLGAVWAILGKKEIYRYFNISYRKCLTEHQFEEAWLKGAYRRCWPIGGENGEIVCDKPLKVEQSIIASWYCSLNQWRWPVDWGNSPQWWRSIQQKEGDLDFHVYTEPRLSLLWALRSVAGEKEILRYWNVNYTKCLTESQFESSWLNGRYLRIFGCGSHPSDWSRLRKNFSSNRVEY